MEQDDRRRPDVGPSHRAVRSRVGIWHHHHHTLHAARNGALRVDLATDNSARGVFRNRPIEVGPTKRVQLRKGQSGHALPVIHGSAVASVDREATPNLVVLEIIEVEHRWCQVGILGEDPRAYVEAPHQVISAAREPGQRTSGPCHRRGQKQPLGAKAERSFPAGRRRSGR
jgi:hypothetical protein